MSLLQWKSEVMSHVNRDRVASQLATGHGVRQDFSEALARDISSIVHKHRMLEAALRSDIDAINQSLAVVRSNLLRVDGDVANASAESTLAVRTAAQAQRSADQIVESFKTEARQLASKFATRDDLDEQASALRFVPKLIS
jgi:hypothetical protein